MAGIRDRRIPCIREIAPELRRNRLLAARRFAAGSVPRLAIMLGQWDGGSIVGSAGAELKKEGKRNARRTKSRTPAHTDGRDQLDRGASPRKGKRHGTRESRDA